MTKLNCIPVILCCFLTGCASMYARQADVKTQVDAWLDNQQFDRALDTIAAMSPEHPDYGYLNNSVPIIEQQRQQFIQTVLSDAQQYEATLDWVNAEQTIQDGLDITADAPELIAQLEFYQQKRHARLKMDEAAILIAQAYYIISAAPHQESKLYNADNRFFAQQQFNQFLEQARKVSRELYALGHQYWQAGKLVQAREALTLSIKTAENELSSELLATLLNAEREQRSLARSEQRRKISEQQPELEQSFYERLNFGDFIGAQKVLNEMTAIGIESTDALQENLNQRRVQRVNQLINSGNTLYNSGYLQEAINRWQQALILAPDNATVIQKLERAETFVNNLERWQDSP
ncbi:MAG: hypothetical protein R3227_16290 [Reinekea sp.]|nr:hypothetical protein [Reinekea sp.]